MPNPVINRRLYQQSISNGLLNNLVHAYKFQETGQPFPDLGSSALNTPLDQANAGAGFTRVTGHVEPFAGNYDGNAFDMVGTLGNPAPQDFSGGGLGSNPLTFSLWFKPSNIQPNNARTAVIIGVWDNDSSGTAESWVVVLNAGDNTKCQMFTRDSVPNLHFTPLTGNITLNAWNFLCGGWDNSSNVAWLSLNNGARQTVAQTSLNGTNGGARFNICNMFPTQREIQMSFEQVLIYQRNFSAADISNLWNNGAGLLFSKFTH